MRYGFRSAAYCCACCRANEEGLQGVGVRRSASENRHEWRALLACVVQAPQRRHEDGSICSLKICWPDRLTSPGCDTAYPALFQGEVLRVPE